VPVSDTRISVSSVSRVPVSGDLASCVIYPNKILYPRIYSMQPKMPNLQYYLICKQETRILVVLPISSKVSQYYSRENLEAKKLLQNPQEQRVDARWTRERDEMEIK
jgi:hypothetical protein